MRLFQFLIAAIVLLFFTACASTRAQVARSEFAWESESLNARNAEATRKQALFYIDQSVQREIERMNAALARQNDLAGADVRKVAANYMDYYAGLDEMRRRTEAEYATVASLYDEQIALGRGFRALSWMADEELRVSRETASAAIAEAMSTAEQVWTEYQRRQPPPVPDPVEPPEPVVIEVPVEVPVPTPTPAPAPEPTPAP